MERDFGAEMTRVFGARLKRAYAIEETPLPQNLLEWLERLQKAEERLEQAPQEANPSAQTAG